jgi:MafB19-like deaminase
MINYDTLFDDENKDLLAKLEAESAGILGRLDNKEGFGNTGIETLRTNKSFEEISQQKWNAFNFGGGGGNDEPQFPQPCEALPFDDDFYKGGINYYKLVQYLKTQYNQIFDSAEFEGIAVNNTSTTSSPTTGIPVTSYYTTIENVPFSYTDNIGNSVVTNLSGRLNTRKCFLELKAPNLQWGWWFTLDKKNKEIALGIEYYYKGTYNKKRDVLSTPQLNDYTIENKYKAIIITTPNINDFVGLISDIYGKDTEKNIKQAIIEEYISVLKDCNNGKQLKFLYNNIPDFVLEDIKNNKKIGVETLWDHMIMLTEYDDTGFLSNFKDASAALIKVLQAVGDSKILYTKFSADPTLIRRIYYNLDGSSNVSQLGLNQKGGLVMAQVPVKNRILFADFLTALCVANKNRGLIDSKKTFYYGKEYKFDANVTGYNENNDEFFLKQLKKVTRNEILIIPDDLPSKVERIPIETSSFEETDEGAYYKPLELVSLVDTETNDAPRTVPAILIKALSDEEEWKVIDKNIRIGFDILALVVGIIVVATTGNPALFALAVADIGLAGIDIGVQALHDELAATEKGRAFLEVWEKVYLVGNLITAGPALIGSIFKAGTLLLRAVETAKNLSVRNFVMACFTKIIIERNIANFTKNTVKEILYGEEALKNWGVTFSFAGITRLQEAGVVIIKALGSDKTVVGYTAIYKGEVIASGTAKEVRDILKKVWGARGAELIVKLEELLVRIRFKDIEEFRILKNLPKFAEKIPSSGTVAKIEIEGKSFFGINSKLSPDTLFLRKKWFNKISWVPPKKIMPLKINQAQSLLHAEGHALMNAFEEIGELPEKLTLFVDRATCNMCKGELPSLMRAMGIKELTIVHGEARVKMILNTNL